ncbi:hypothetical protein FE257_008705 [Aspergillus nanangensis]|uniref:Polysaccharide export protein n=1 Tax=Aspergillus nanangensis TaxID=2582783 RepID=A0AAD4CLB4_ASPNN|nr:hypothetical protein FE257_008705 [Aspergillus nanangensis]
MILSTVKRSLLLPRKLRRRLIQFLALFVLLWSTAEVLLIRHRILEVDARPPATLPRQERIYVASIHWNNENVLRNYWNDAVVDLARALGPENIYLSVFESGSWDDTKGALRDLDVMLDRIGVSRNITVSDITHDDEISAKPAEHGWIDTSRGKKELRRIPYLARLRNLSLQPLHQLLLEGETFDRVLFLNDVVFTKDDVINLISTNNGEYGAACSLDFSKPPLYYDTFALRDSQGHEHLMQSWPFFRSKKSRNAMKALSPVPVASCWNGMVAMPAKPFMSNPPLEFRGVPDSLSAFHVEGSECCLIHADNPLSKERGVFVNPNVRVGYNGPAYAAVHPAQHWLSSWRIMWSIWESRVRRLFTSPILKEWLIHRRVGAWEGLNEQNVEPGEFCLINEMQVLITNGWAHV